MKKQWLLAAGCLVLLLVSPLPAAAVDESKPCNPEPTDQFIVYGDVLSGTECQGPAGDLDIYRFTASTGDVIRVIAVDLTLHGAIFVCLELFDPDNQPVLPKTCGNASVQIDPTLTKTGVHTLFVSESGNDAAFSYNLSLERLTPARTDWPPIDHEQLVSDELSPVGDIDTFRLNGRAGDIIRIVGVDRSLHGAIFVCVELFDPDGMPVVPLTCGNASVQVDPTLTVTGIHTLVVSESGNDSAVTYSVNVSCLSGSCPGKLPVCEVALSSIGGTLDIEFTLRTETPAMWNVWLSVMNMTYRLWSVGPFEIDPMISVPFSVPSFPALGTIGFLTTLTTPDSPDSGIICSDWETVDTGDPTPGATAPTADQLRRLFPSSQR